ncbi:hypothetical protein BIZ42_02210 [Stenotrophomonas sp. LM091]|uniref:hypothetical protein n=1 Tax=Stenotrophomonas sp. LM091 TaxID=1904944 RepID=UPI00031E3ABE|nr:hypothetical protein [Stenotrophomonas sp. LM091]AOX61105.1 hypothetical protein BIZ42_02210 [Stenotrophomonas sp. LM091]
MKYEVEFNGLAQCAHYLEVEAESPEDALRMAKVAVLSDASFAIEEWVNEPTIESLSEEGMLIASNYELDIANVEDYE